MSNCTLLSISFIEFLSGMKQGGGRTRIVYNGAQVLRTRALLPPMCGFTSGGEGSGIRVDSSVCFPALPGILG